MHHQEIISSNVAAESESNTNDSNTNLTNLETSRISSSSNNIHNNDLSDDPLSSVQSVQSVQSQPEQQQQEQQQQQQQDNNLINLSGWSVVASWRNENFQMNEHQNAYLENMFASEIIPRVYVGSQMAATDKAWLEDHKITHILTVTDKLDPSYPESYTYKVISIRDYNSQNIIAYFDTTYKFIQSALQEDEGNILVHCQAGISRSATVMIAYIMKARRMSYDDAFEFVRSKRSLICPNLGFRDQLKLYESLGCQNLKTNPKYWKYLVKKWGDKLLLSFVSN